MIPTFFVVSLVIFLVLNMAPGKPGQANQQGEKGTSESGNQNEAYRIFKQQFNLDKPILINTRFSIDQEEITGMVSTIVDYTYKKDLPEDQKPLIKDVVEAQNELEDLGNYIVPHLFHIATEDSDPDRRWYAARKLTVNAKRALVGEFSREKLTAEEKKLNNEIDIENTTISRWSYKRDASQEEKDKITANWKGWYEKNKGRYEYSTSDAVGIFFFDTRFAKYWHNLARFDLGVSNLDRRPITDKIVSKLKYSLTLSFGTVLLVYMLAVPLGIFSAVRQGSRADQILTVVLFMLYSLPTFFTGVLLLKLLSIGPDFTLFPAMPSQEALDVVGGSVSEGELTFSRAATVLLPLIYLGWSMKQLVKKPESRTPMGFVVRGTIALLIFVFVSMVMQVWMFGAVSMFPTGGFESANSDDMTTLEHLGDICYHLVLPLFCLTYGSLAALSRYARTGLLDIIRADYIRTARAKGLSESVVIIKHAVRNGMIPILTLLGTVLPALIGGSVVIEVIFNIPGMGLYLFESITLRDYNAVMGVFLCQSALTLIGLLLSDISYALVDPRISFK